MVMVESTVKLLQMPVLADVAHIVLQIWPKSPVLATLLVLSVGLCFMLLMVGFWLVLMLLD